MKKLALTALLAVALTAGIAESSSGINTSNFCDCQGVGIPQQVTKQVVPIDQPGIPKRAETKQGFVNEVVLIIKLWFTMGIY